MNRAEIFRQLTRGIRFSRPTVKDEVEDMLFSPKATVTGTNVPDSLDDFTFLSSHSVPAFVTKFMSGSGFNRPTPVQARTIPILLSGRDVMVCAPTGSGKTLAFMIPVVSVLKKPKNHGFRSLVVVPTKELASQLEREFLKISRIFRICLLTGSKLAALKTLTRSFDILISTPLVLIQGVDQGLIDLSRLQMLILDEADRLLEPSFLEQTDKILSGCPKTMTKGLFTATLSPLASSLAATFMRDPVRVVVGSLNSAATTIKQELVFVGQEESKLMILEQLLRKGLEAPILIFTESIDKANFLHENLAGKGLKIDFVHSEKSRSERDTIVERFRMGKVWILITTDLLARGMDFKKIGCVVNYDFPQTSISYIHRIGRTGRAGQAGTAITLFTTKDKSHLREIAQVMELSGCAVPKYMLEE